MKRGIDMQSVSLLRLNLLRLFYLVLILGIGFAMHVWAMMLGRLYYMKMDRGTVVCMLFALSVLAILGLRYPLKMLPVLFWEMTWKASWLLGVALPHWLRGQWSRDLGVTTFNIAFIVLLIPLVPWSYVFEQYVSKPGDAWWRRAASAPVEV
jgi:hypothetical protein